MHSDTHSREDLMRHPPHPDPPRPPHSRVLAPRASALILKSAHSRELTRRREAEGKERKGKEETKPYTKERKRKAVYEARKNKEGGMERRRRVVETKDKNEARMTRLLTTPTSLTASFTANASIPMETPSGIEAHGLILRAIVCAPRRFYIPQLQFRVLTPRRRLSRISNRNGFRQMDRFGGVALQGAYLGEAADALGYLGGACLNSQNFCSSLDVQ
ncbi:hypothetical protein R3P38DRAFT_223419 [Favolaschia claudopus]|uniref:Uncharacterized protein n=1 Tax=Favolaschia claudopus TaxID=2862362 RepID=A0AAV9ZUP1_9AGAR